MAASTSARLRLGRFLGSLLRPSCWARHIRLWRFAQESIAPPPHPPPPAVFPLEICPEGPCLGLSKYLGKEKYRQSEKPSEREREYFFCCVMVCTAIHHLHHSGLADLPRVSYDHDHFSGLGGWMHVLLTWRHHDGNPPNFRRTVERMLLLASVVHLTTCTHPYVSPSYPRASPSQALICFLSSLDRCRWMVRASRFWCLFCFVFGLFELRRRKKI